LFICTHTHRNIICFI